MEFEEYAYILKRQKELTTPEMEEALKKQGMLLSCTLLSVCSGFVYGQEYGHIPVRENDKSMPFEKY